MNDENGGGYTTLGIPVFSLSASALYDQQNNCNTQIFQSVIESNNTFKGGSFIHIRLNCIYNVIYSKS